MRKWHDLRRPGVTDGAAALLKQIRLRGNQKGTAVLTMDLRNGPFTGIELQNILAALDDANAKGRVSVGNYVLGWLFALLGQRPVQYASLKICDLQVRQTDEGTITYVLGIPRAKQRPTLSRHEFKERIVTRRIGDKLVQHAEEVRDAFSSVLADPPQAPLFPARQNRKHEPQGFRFHRIAVSIARTMQETFSKFRITSERTGMPLHVTATRFRRTLGTRAALEGHGELIIAELLDHTDTQNVGVYVQATPQILERIDGVGRA